MIEADVSTLKISTYPSTHSQPFPSGPRAYSFETLFWSRRKAYSVSGRSAAGRRSPVNPLTRRSLSSFISQPHFDIPRKVPNCNLVSSDDGSTLGFEVVKIIRRGQSIIMMTTCILWLGTDLLLATQQCY